MADAHRPCRLVPNGSLGTPRKLNAMCAIAGIVTSSGRESMDLAATLLPMTAAMTHRGPDDHGVWISADRRVGLASRRLSVRDVSSAGHMPIGNSDGTLWLIHNGEIYNADALRSELEALGYGFRSQSDSEVILHGYDAWGPGIVERLRGMFAFAIYDERSGKQRCLFLARDRLGIKPLYFARTPRRLVFASELKALRASGLVSSCVSPAGVIGYLLTGSIPSPLTIYHEAQALEPAHTLTVEMPEGRLDARPKRYWSFPSPEDTRVTLDEAIGRIRCALEDAVRSHLVSDVPLGAFLSGGLDSSAVVALMHAAGAGPIRTCSMVFEEAAYSEASYSRAVARAVGCEHYERIITAEQVRADLDCIFRSMDQPTIDGVNTYFVSKTAREAGLTVALSGLGGDELFGGYTKTFRVLPNLVRALRLARAIPGGVPFARASIRLLRPGESRVREAFDRPPSPASAYLACRGLFSPLEVRSLVSPEVWDAAIDSLERVLGIGEPDPLAKDFDADPSLWISRAELEGYTRNQLLRDTDVFSMAHSLEVRVPLLDDRLIETVLRLPAIVRHAGKPKDLLLRAVSDLLPPEIRQRRQKQGFVLPFDVWLRGPLKPSRHESDRELDGFLRPQGAEHVYAEFESRRLHWSRPWALTALRGWWAASEPRAC